MGGRKLEQKLLFLNKILYVRNSGWGRLFEKQVKDLPICSGGDGYEGEENRQRLAPHVDENHRIPISV
jgi:hypothetical protein